jgi:hypothetical protein
MCILLGNVWQVFVALRALHRALGDASHWLIVCRKRDDFVRQLRGAYQNRKGYDHVCDIKARSCTAIQCTSRAVMYCDMGFWWAQISLRFARTSFLAFQAGWTLTSAAHPCQYTLQNHMSLTPRLCERNQPWSASNHYISRDQEHSRSSWRSGNGGKSKTWGINNPQVAVRECWRGIDRTWLLQRQVSASLRVTVQTEHSSRLPAQIALGHGIKTIPIETHSQSHLANVAHIEGFSRFVKFCAIRRSR